MVSISEVDGTTPFGDSTVALAEARTVNRHEAPLFRLAREINGSLGKRSGGIAQRNRRQVESGDDDATGVIAILKIGEDEVRVCFLLFRPYRLISLLSFVSSSL